MKVRALGYMAAESPEAKQWEEFGPEILGMQLVDGDRPGSVYLRMDERHHRIAIHPGEKDRLAYLGWEMPCDDDLEEAVEELTRAGYAVTEGTEDECEERAVRRFVSVLDPGGGDLEDLAPDQGQPLLGWRARRHPGGGPPGLARSSLPGLPGVQGIEPAGQEVLAAGAPAHLAARRLGERVRLDQGDGVHRHLVLLGHGPAHGLAAPARREARVFAAEHVPA